MVAPDKQPMNRQAGLGGMRGPGAQKAKQSHAEEGVLGVHRALEALPTAGGWLPEDSVPPEQGSVLDRKGKVSAALGAAGSWEAAAGVGQGHVPGSPPAWPCP